VPDKVIQIPFVGNVAFPSAMSDDEIGTHAARLYREAAAKHVPPSAEHPEPVGTAGGFPRQRVVPDTLLNLPPVSSLVPGPAPTGSVWDRVKGNFLQTVLPSTTLSDYLDGPLYMAQHPIDSLGLLGGAIKGAHQRQFQKAGDAYRRMVAAPTAGDALMAGSEMVGHGAAAALPIVGPVAADKGEQIGSGDIAGGLAGAAALLAPYAVPPAVKLAGQASSPARNLLGGRLTADAVQRMNTALAATTRENKARSARVAPEMVKRGIWNKDLPALEKRAATESDTAGQAVGAELARVATQRTDVLPLVERLEQEKAPYLDTSDTGHRVVIDAAPVDAIQKLQDTLMEYGDRISMQSLNKVRQQWDEVVKAGKGFTTADLGTHWKTWAAREGRTVLREELGKASPDMNTVMAEYSFWQNIEDVSHATNQRRVGQSGGLTPAIASAGGAVIGEMLAPGAGIAAKLGGAALGAKLGASLRRLVNSPGYQMWSAVQKQRLADALAGGDHATATRLVADGLAAASAIESSHRSGFPVNRVTGPEPEQTTARRRSLLQPTP
jgi:hypothetical protein